MPVGPGTILHWCSPVCLAGLGSPQGDDDLGWHVVSAVRQRLSISSVATVQSERWLHCVCLASGIQLLDFLAGTGTLILVDAILTSTAPGTRWRLTWPWEEKVQPYHWSSHGLGPGHLLSLAETLGWLPRHVELWGVEIDPVQNSAAVAQAVRELTDELTAALNDWRAVADVQDSAGAIGFNG